MSDTKPDIKIGYDTYQTPKAITLYPVPTESIELSLDAVDGMTFGIISHLSSHNNFIADLIKYKKTIGGKVLLLVPENLATAKKSIDDTHFLDRVMYLKNANTFSDKILNSKDILDNLSQRFEIITDKNELLANARKISELLINNAEWAGKHDHKRRLYNVEAIKARISDPHIAATGIFSQGQIIGFSRVYIVNEYFGYFSDIVINAQYRNLGLMTLLMQQIKTQALEHQAHNLLLIAGTPQLIQTYQRYGFAAATEKVIINNKILIGCASPTAGILKKYQEEFVIPECPKHYLE